MKARTRAIIARAAIAAVYVGLAAFALSTGKGYKVYFDNDGGASAAVVSVNGQKPLKVRVDGLREVMVKGRKHHSFTVQYEDGRPSYTGVITVPFGFDAASLGVADLANGDEPAYKEVDFNTSEH